MFVQTSCTPTEIWSRQPDHLHMWSDQTAFRLQRVLLHYMCIFTHADKLKRLKIVCVNTRWKWGQQLLRRQSGFWRRLKITSQSSYFSGSCWWFQTKLTLPTFLVQGHNLQSTTFNIQNHLKHTRPHTKQPCNFFLVSFIRFSILFFHHSLYNSVHL